MKYTAILGIRSEIKVLQLAEDAITLSFYLIKKNHCKRKKSDCAFECLNSQRVLTQKHLKNNHI